MRIMNIIFKDFISEKTRVFIDNIRMKESKTIYNNKESLSGIRRYILKYL
jgi:hypothetical protein